MPTLWRILKKKSSEEFHPYPYIAGVMNCSFWVLYGLPIIHPDSTLVITINSVGLVMELSYLAIFFIYTHKKYRIYIVGLLVAVIILLAIVAVLTLQFCHTYESRSMVVGIICVVFGVIMYASPLSIMKTVIKTKSVEFMPLSLSWAGFSNGIAWTVYALLEFDIYILIGNALGAISGAAQLILYAYYCKGTLPGRRDGDAIKQTEVQLETKLPA
ncbi:hypothetical protein Leryth_006895 [Lithospermum erythrorhizon]|nr:hypothetical protein Leryth_006895 [Lithospermum erythrorhizon]